MQASRSKQRAAMDTWQVYQTMFTDHLEFVNSAPMTVRRYRIPVDQCGQNLKAEGMPTDRAFVTREHLIEWMRCLPRPKDPDRRRARAGSKRP